MTPDGRLLASPHCLGPALEGRGTTFLGSLARGRALLGLCSQAVSSARALTSQAICHSGPAAAPQPHGRPCSRAAHRGCRLLFVGGSPGVPAQPRVDRASSTTRLVTADVPWGAWGCPCAWALHGVRVALVGHRTDVELWQDRCHLGSGVRRRGVRPPGGAGGRGWPGANCGDHMLASRGRGRGGKKRGAGACLGTPATVALRLPRHQGQGPPPALRPPPWCICDGPRLPGAVGSAGLGQHPGPAWATTSLAERPPPAPAVGPGGSPTRGGWEQPPAHQLPSGASLRPLWGASSPPPRPPPTTLFPDPRLPTTMMRLVCSAQRLLAPEKRLLLFRPCGFPAASPGFSRCTV